jgi:nucleoid-associated protein YgaU
MRAALLTTAIVLLVLAIYAQGRLKRRDDTASEPAGQAPAVSAGPALAGDAPEATADTPSYRTATSDPPLPEARRHVVQEGETLESIARAYYGDEGSAVTLYEANRDQIRDPKQLRAGQILIVP